MCKKWLFLPVQCEPLTTVEGLQWGTYVGSPDLPAPTLTWVQNHGSTVSSLVALPTGEVFGLGPNSCLLVMYSKEKGQWAYITNWHIVCNTHLWNTCLEPVYASVTFAPITWNLRLSVAGGWCLKHRRKKLDTGEGPMNTLKENNFDLFPINHCCWAPHPLNILRCPFSHWRICRNISQRPEHRWNPPMFRHPTVTGANVTEALDTAP